ncbi:MAG: bifunctional 2-methylcitrate dehydratase/aconitate hydratase [Dehalococcoidia bacterium]|nr:bifunctional 2-methylcitrate dehydratase/aconitate hydratase [Dehalococcoidia bacterium]
MESTNLNYRAEPDEVLTRIADYVSGFEVTSPPALESARLCIADSLACGFEALGYEDCARMLGPVVPGTEVPDGARVPGTPFQLDPVAATFNLGTLVRWLDFNDSFYGETVIHPSDNIAAMLMIGDWMSRTRLAEGREPLPMRAVMEATVKAYEVQGGLALENDFNAMGLDHTASIKIATCAAAAGLLGCSREQVINAVSHAWVDGQPLATFRRAPNTGPRKSWAAGDAASRGVWLALLALRGEEGVPSALTAPRWGFYDVYTKGQPLRFQRPFETYVIENVLFKIGYPAAFHAQSAVEAAIGLHELVSGRLDDVERVEVRCHKSSMIILNKTGPLHNFADRDHCLQYMMARGLIFGKLTADDYSDEAAADPRIDALREKMHLVEDETYSRDYLDPAKRTNSNAIQAHFRDGSSTPVSEVLYPLGHPRRRAEGLPLLTEKLERSVSLVFSGTRREQILAVAKDQSRLESMAVNEFVDLLTV